MVRKFVSLLYAPVRGLHEAAYLLALFALGSQLLAVVRARILAGEFGAGPTLDLYNAAFRLPDLLFAAVASMVSIYVVIPLLSDRLKDGPDEARRFLSGALTFFTLFIGAVSLGAYMAAPLLLPKMYPGFGASELLTLTHLTQIMLLQPVLLGASNLFASITQLRQRFVVYAISPLLYNIGIIIGALWFYPALGPAGLAWGVVLGAALHLAIQVPYLLTDPAAPKWFGAVSFAQVRQIIAISLPRTLALSTQQLAMVALVAIASLFAAGSITVFSFAYELQAVPLSIIGVSYSVAAFPTLARLFSSGDRDAFFAQITVAARHILFWSLPVIALVVVLRAQIVRVILGGAAFDWTDTRLTAAALAIFVLSLAAHGLVLLLVRGYYAAGNTRKPLLTCIVATAFGVLAAVLFLDLFKESLYFRTMVESMLRIDGMPGSEVVMLSFGYTLGITLNATMLMVLFQRDFQRFGSVLWSGIWKSGIGALFSGVSAYLLLQLLDDYLDLNTFLGIFTQGLVAGVGGLLAFIAVLWLLKSQELLEAASALTRHIFRTHPVVPEQEV